MKTILFLTTVFICLNGTTQDFNVFFESNQFTLSISEKNRLDHWIKTHPKITLLTLNGYTDSIGTNNYNLHLSTKRVKSVQSYLLKNGIKYIILQTAAKGELNNKNDLSFNRRVSLTIEKDLSKIRSFTDLKSKIQPEKQSFKLLNKRDTIVTCAMGTLLKIPAYAFVNKNNQLVDSVELTVQEFYSTEDFFSSNLSTSTTENQLIETQGMVKISAKKGNIPLQLRDTLDLYFPAQNQRKDYETFWGEKDKDMTVKWKPSNSVNQSEIEDCKIMMAPNWKDYTLEVKLKNQEEGVTNLTFNGKYEEKINYAQLRTMDLSICAKQFLKDINFFSFEDFRNKSYQRIRSNKLGFINCDRFVKEKTSMFSLQMKVDPNLQFVNAFIVFKGLKSVLLKTFSNGNLSIMENYPVDFCADIIVYAQKDGLPYFVKIEDIQKLNKQEIYADVNQTSFADFDEVLTSY